MWQFNQEKNKEAWYIPLIPHQSLLCVLTDNTADPFCYCQIHFCSNDVFNHPTAHLQLMAVWMAISRRWKLKTPHLFHQLRQKRSLECPPRRQSHPGVMKRQMCAFISALVALLLLSVFLWRYIKQVILECGELHIYTAITQHVMYVLVIHIDIQIYTYIERCVLWVVFTNLLN